MLLYILPAPLLYLLRVRRPTSCTAGSLLYELALLRSELLAVLHLPADRLRIQRLRRRSLRHLCLLYGGRTWRHLPVAGEPRLRGRIVLQEREQQLRHALATLIRRMHAVVLAEVLARPLQAVLAAPHPVGPHIGSPSHPREPHR